VRPVLLSLLFACPLSLLANDETHRAFALEDDVVAIFGALVRSNGYGMRETENAAFIVRGEAGAHRCVEWPFTGEKRRQTFHGIVPRFTVAIAHTHPKTSRHPSRVDRQTAVRTGLPVFVLTPVSIFVATPEGTTVALVQGRWAEAAPPRVSCRSRETPRFPLSAE
jgi:hypothetical protein